MREVVVIANDTTFRAYDVESGAVTAKPEDTTSYGQGVVIKGMYFSAHPSKPLIVATKLERASEVFHRYVMPDVPTAFAVNHNGTRLVAGFKNGRLACWDLTTGCMMKSFTLAPEISGGISFIKIALDEEAMLVCAGQTCALYAFSNFVQLADATAESREESVPPLATYSLGSAISAMDAVFECGELAVTIVLGSSSGRIAVWQPHRCEQPIWLCDLLAEVTGIVLLESTMTLLVGSKHPKFAVCEFDLLHCVQKYRNNPNVSWEEVATFWPTAALPTSLTTGEALTDVRLMVKNSLETLLATAIGDHVLLWDCQKRSVKRILQMERVSDISFAMKYPTVAHLAQDGVPVGVPNCPSPLGQRKNQLQTSLSQSTVSGSTVLEDQNALSNGMIGYITRSLYVERPVPLRLTKNNKTDIEVQLVAAVEARKYATLAREWEERHERARMCYNTMALQIIRDAVPNKYLVECREQSKLLHTSVNPLIGMPNIHRKGKDQEPGYFVVPPSWQIDRKNQR